MLREGKYKWMIKAYDKAGNIKEVSRILYYQSTNWNQPGIGGSTLGQEDSSQEFSLKDRLAQTKEDIQEIPEDLTQGRKRMTKPGSFIILGSLFLGMWLFIVWKRKRENKK